MNRRTPLGFYVTSIIAAAFGVKMLAFAVALDGGPSRGALFRAGAALLAAVAAVAVEALWLARHWVYRATLALALGYAALVTARCVADDGLAGLGVAFWFLLFSGMLVVPIVLYVRDRSIALFGPVRPAPPLPPVVGAPNRPTTWW